MFFHDYKMSSHFKWYPASAETIVPWNARYSFPSQANAATKLTPRIPPKNGSNFAPGNVIRLEFPAQGYVNPLNTTLEFDVTLSGWQTAGTDITRIQNNIQSIFQRVRLLYGATPSEDIINYNVITRALTEWTSTNQNGTMDQTSISEGIGGYTFGIATSGNPPASAANTAYGNVNTRQNYIQGIDNSNNTASANFTGGAGAGKVPNASAQTGYQGNSPLVPNGNCCTRRYQVTFTLGLFNQDKLIPTKFMASQLAIEITLERPDFCLFTIQGTATGNPPTYGVGNVNLIPEILVFDASYDAMFLKGLQEGGVPIKFSSWHTFVFGTQNSSTMMLQIQERSRSVKALFAIQRKTPPTNGTDSGAMLFDTSPYAPEANSMQNYQYRIGGRYFPAAPVQLSINPGTGITNGGAEAWLELQKALNIVGDYRLSSSVNTLRWAVPASVNTVSGTNQPELDFTASLVKYNASGNPYIQATTTPSATVGNSFAGNQGSCCFSMAINLETSNGVEISGLNAEEQSDIALQIYWKNGQQLANVIEVYSYFDAMWVLRENNVLELIQ